MGWVIAGKSSDAVPEIGTTYNIRDRKGTFTGQILKVSGNFATVQRIEGDIRWASNENRLFIGSQPDVVSIRDILSYLIELSEEEYLELLERIDG